MLGYWGIRSSLKDPEMFTHQLRALKKLYEMGCDNLELMLCPVRDAEDLHRAKS